MKPWDVNAEPYVVRWSHPTGDRLTRHTSTVKTFATEAEAIAALIAPFGPNTSHAHIVRFTPVVGAPAPMIASRKRGQKMQRISS